MVNRPTLIPQKSEQDTCIMWVVFSNDTDIRFLKLLRTGFRHCFVIIKQDNRWILIDPMSNKTDISLLPHPEHFNLPRFFVEQGKTVCKIREIKTPNKIAPIIPMSCVETVKKIIGLHARWVLTPYQLYKKLMKLKKKG